MIVLLVHLVMPLVLFILIYWAMHVSVRKFLALSG
jgi:hypothetical protein